MYSSLGAEKPAANQLRTSLLTDSLLESFAGLTLKGEQLAYSLGDAPDAAESSLSDAAAVEGLEDALRFAAGKARLLLPEVALQRSELVGAPLLNR